MNRKHTVEIDHDWGGYTIYGWDRFGEPTDWSLIAYRVIFDSFHEALDYGRHVVGRGMPIMKPINGRWVRVGYAKVGAA